MKIGSLTWITDIIRLIPPEIGYADLDRLQVMQVDSMEWLESKYAQVIDPDLQLYSGTQYLDDKKNNFGIFLDSSPDRWGRVLMKRRE